MLFNSFSFLCFFPIVVLCYYIIPAKLRNIWLLLCSYYFYMNWNARYALLLALSTVITFLSGLLIEWANDRTFYRKLFLGLSFSSNLLILFFFKYFNFFLSMISKSLSVFHLSLALPTWDILLPVGISFYTFQALSYTADVYKGTIKAEHNIIQYSLFVSFFPQLVAGPIERSHNLLTRFTQIAQSPKAYPAFPYEKAKKGMLLMLLGYFEKCILANRASIIVDTIFDSYTSYQGYYLIFASMAFAIQIYCDFGGYSHIAIGAANVLGIDLMENFHQPYFATTIKDFWRRWHISLSTWFRDYLYIPLGGNRKGTIRKYTNLFITFLVSGLWHGAGMHFVIWGGLHGLYQIIGDLLRPAHTKFQSTFKGNRLNWLKTLLNRFITFTLVTIAWVFFRANSVRDGFSILKRCSKIMDFSFFSNQGIFALGLSTYDLIIFMIGLFALFIIDFIHEKDISIVAQLNKLSTIPRWMIYFILITPVFLQIIASFGEPASSFIYFQF